jgi:transcriptional regulator with XRE-family HTH domain
MSNSLSLHVGKRVKELRKKLGLTQEELAEKTGLDYKYLQRIEGRSPTNLKLETIEKFAKALKVNPAKLLDF